MNLWYYVFFLWISLFGYSIISSEEKSNLAEELSSDEKTNLEEKLLG